MDYVVFGIGFGATILVLGLLVRDIGPRLRFRAPADPEGVFHAEELVAKVSWSRYCSALGSVLAIGGALFVLTTFVSMLLMLSDRTGGWVMLGSLALLILVVGYWTWAFFDRFGSYGILPEREEPAIEEGPPAPAVTAPNAREEQAAHDDAPAEAKADDIEVQTEIIGPAVPDADTPEAEPEPDEGDEQPAAMSKAEPARGSEDATPAGDAETRLETPEERLAQMESPIDHGSAEGDLDIAAAGRRRPQPRTDRPGGQRRGGATAESDRERGSSEVDAAEEPGSGHGSDDEDRPT